MNTGPTLCVAPRLPPTRNADKLIVPSHGEILEEGTPRELLEKKGRSYRLYTLQAHREQLINA